MDPKQRWPQTHMAALGDQATERLRETEARNRHPRPPRGRSPLSSITTAIESLVRALRH